MHAAEKIAFAIRHNQYLDHADRLWNYVRPAYDRLSYLAARKGLTRVINGTDRVLVAPRWRMVTEEYEPAVWLHLMNEVRAGDVIADVGAYIGLYTIALAKRVGQGGRVIAFEPDPANFTALKEHVSLNSLADRVETRSEAVGASTGQVKFAANASSESSVANSMFGPTSGDECIVQCVSLDEIFAETRLDILKIDVEGYEEKVIAGALRLLKDDSRGPRAIFIEVHPYAWDTAAMTSDSLLGLLDDCNYQVWDLAGNLVERIEEYGEVIASRRY
jgi:FkbM family methyltransferase